MPKFVFTAKDKDGKTVEGVVEATDQDELVTSLQEKGLLIISVGLEEKKAAKRKARKFRRKVKMDDMVIFSRQMTTLLNAGVSLLKSLTIVIRQVESKPLYDALEKIHKDVEGGFTFHDAMARHPKIFSTLWVTLVETGETSGQLAPVFEQLTNYMKASEGIRRRVISAMIYPAILICVAVAAILVFALRVIPTFGEIYQGFDIELPLLTQMVLNFSDFMRRYFLVVLAGVVVLGFLFRRYISTKRGRLQFDGLMLRLPLLGLLVEGMAIERFATGLGTLIKSGIPILFGLDIAGKVAGNKIIENALERVKEEVREGRTMTEPLEESGIFPPIVTQMVSIGEETGKLSEMLERIAEYYKERVSSFVDRLTAAMEPMILIFMGITVGILVIAMFLPIFKIATSGIR